MLRSALCKIIVIFFFTLITPINAFSWEKGIFKPPKEIGKKTFTFKGITYKFDKGGYYDASDPEDGKKETYVKIYENNNGMALMKYQINSVTWAWAIMDNPRNKSDLVNNYFIRDSNCDNIFDEKYPANYNVILPKCLSKKP